MAVVAVARAAAQGALAQTALTPTLVAMVLEVREVRVAMAGLASNRRKVTVRPARSRAVVVAAVIVVQVERGLEETAAQAKDNTR
jgi:hypothetical protein